MRRGSGGAAHASFATACSKRAIQALFRLYQDLIKALPRLVSESCLVRDNSRPVRDSLCQSHVAFKQACRRGFKEACRRVKVRALISRRVHKQPAHTLVASGHTH